MDLFNCDPSVHSYNAIMNILVEHGYYEQAHKVYMRMKDRGVCSDVCTYTVGIKAFCRTRRSSAALRLLKNMHFMGKNGEKKLEEQERKEFEHSGQSPHA
ncbi:hypothetical protein PIB30_074448 [Stylosanthes scabra]|uniref:Pentatricopeptide repeat-containing protein n=1 Tax=Stylosanthes scabra TaxID=79078 RepID=A0ABU6ZND5_9FABA|nr:hypothetical protein [Stylosanthes scabra]